MREERGEGEAEGEKERREERGEGEEGELRQRGRRGGRRGERERPERRKERRESWAVLLLHCSTRPPTGNASGHAFASAVTISLREEEEEEEGGWKSVAFVVQRVVRLLGPKV
eukprot:453174-Rhodomonas_salina.1